MKTAIRIKQLFFLAFITLLMPIGGFASEEKAIIEDQENKHWSETVEDKNIQFDGGQEDKASTDALEAVKVISKNIRDLKKEVVSLNKDLRVMEEKLLFPSNTKYSVFVSSSAGQFFTLESIKLKLDGKLVAAHLFSEKQRQALTRGGVQQLYTTNLSEGDHTATVFFTGLGPLGRPYKRAQTLNFEKGPSGEYLEIAIIDDGAAQEPVFQMKQW